MDSKELLALLDLKGEAIPAVTASTLITPGEARLHASATALAVDAWGLRRGRDLLAESERLRAAASDEFAAADFFCAAFDPEPRLLNGCAEPLRREFLAQLLETPAYRVLHAATRLDDTASAIATAHFAEEFARFKKDEAANAADEIGREMAVLRAAGRAVKGAEGEVEELHETAAALGLGAGSPGRNDPRVVAESFRRVRTDPALRRICELAGRFRRVAQGRQRRKVIHGLDDIVGVEPAATSASCCRSNWPGSRIPSSNSTPYAASSNGKPSAGSTMQSSPSARGRSSWYWTNRGAWTARSAIPPRHWPSRWPGSPGSSEGGAGGAVA